MGIHPSLARHHASTGQFAGARTDSLSSKIVTAVRDALFAKKMKPGEFLGTENELAHRFCVSRIVARDAQRTLQALKAFRY